MPAENVATRRVMGGRGPPQTSYPRLADDEGCGGRDEASCKRAELLGRQAASEAKEAVRLFHGEGFAVVRGEAVAVDGVAVLGGGITHIAGPAILRILLINLEHILITVCLGKD